MLDFNNNLDITKNIKIIEMLKSQILTDVAHLNASFLDEESDIADKTELFADLTILIYILAKRLGISPSSLYTKINKKLKLGALEQDDIFREDIKELLRYLNSNDYKS